MAKKIKGTGIPLPSFSEVAGLVKKCPRANKDHAPIDAENTDYVTWPELERTLDGLEKLCCAHRETQKAELEGLKKAIYVASATVGLVITIVQFGLHFLG